MELNIYQKKIKDYFINNPTDNILVNAYAGTGKSSTIKLLTEIPQTLDVYLAFNNSIAEEFKEKITNPKTKIFTLHSLAYSIMLTNVKENLKVKRNDNFVYLDNLKTSKIVDQILKKEKFLDFKYKLFLKEGYKNLYDLCRLTLTDMHSLDQVSKLIDDYNLFVDYEENFASPENSEIIKNLNYINFKSLNQFEEDYIIDFTDMLYITYLKLEKKDWTVPFWNLYTNIYVDECQDLSTLQLNFLHFIKRPKGRYVFVGDSNQSCYNFSGANAYSFNLIPKLFSPIEKFDLPICYRCPVSHLERVRRIFNIPILPKENAPKGEIKYINKKDIVKFVKVGDLIISRKNKWLSDVVVNLINNNIPIYMEDKTLVTNIKKIITNSKAVSIKDFEIDLKEEISKYEESINQIIARKNNKDNEDNKEEEEENEELKKVSEIQDLNGKIDNIEFTLKLLKNYSLQEKNKSKNGFNDYVNNLLNTTNNKKAVRLSSVHKAKGLEAETVFVLNEGKICKDFRNSKEQNKQEVNLSYISTTRSKNKMFLVREDKV